MIGMSACLAGCNCTYRGDANLVEELRELVRHQEVVMVCPEVAGGLPTPRLPSEIVTENPLKIVNIEGEDVTDAFMAGARRCAQDCLDHHVNIAILKNNSPSCGVGTIYDGTFSHTVISGDGVFSRILRENGIQLYTEVELNEFLQAINVEGENYE